MSCHCQSGLLATGNGQCGGVIRVARAGGVPAEWSSADRRFGGPRRQDFQRVLCVFPFLLALFRARSGSSDALRCVPAAGIITGATFASAVLGSPIAASAQMNAAADGHPIQDLPAELKTHVSCFERGFEPVMQVNYTLERCSQEAVGDQ